MSEIDGINIREIVQSYFPKQEWRTRLMILTSQKTKAGEVKIYVEVLKYSYHGTGDYRKKILRISTEVWVLPKNWSQNKQRILDKDPLHEPKNVVINDKLNAIEDYLNKRKVIPYSFRTPSVIAANVEKFRVDFEKLLELFPPAKQEGTKGIIEYFDEYVEFRKANGTARGTWKEFITVKNRLKNYEKHLGSKLYFQDMNLTFSDDFSVWMFKKPYDTATVEKTFAVLKTFLNHYYKRRKEVHIPLDATFMEKEFKKGKKKQNPANPLTYNEFVELTQKTFDSAALNKTKDRFILQCSTGLRYSDIDKITPDKIESGRIMIKPVKTEETKEINTIYINLNKFSKAILVKYKYDTSSLKISNQKYNLSLKDMFKKLEWKVRTSHNARDTFISICVQKKVPLEVILEWTGQSSYSIMKRYIKVPDDYKKKEMNRAFNERKPITKRIKAGQN
jgi:Phage integrase SAM-like domain